MKKIMFFFLFFMSFISSAQAYETIHHAMAVLGLFDAATATFQYRISPQSYLVRTTIQTNGIFGNFYPFTAEYKTTGNVKNNLFQTTSYTSDSKSRFNTRKKEMFYDTNGKPIYRISTKNSSDKKKVEFLRPPDNIHTTDLQTVLAEIITQYTKMNFCNARMHVFDGKKNFDIVFNDEGKDILSENNYSSYRGEAVKCSFYADNLGQKSDDLIFQITPSNPIYVWIIKDKSTYRPFIAKMEKPSTILGKLTVYTHSVEFKD